MAASWNQIALEGWLRTVLEVQTHDATVVLADGKTEAGVYLRGDAVVLCAFDDERTVLAKIKLVPA